MSADTELPHPELPRPKHCPICVAAPKRGAASPYRGEQIDQKQVGLETFAYEAGIVIARCCECDGLWLEEGQLRLIQDTRQHDYEHVPATDVVARHRHTEPDPGPPPPCPRCDEEMWQSTFKTSGVHYLSCLTCGGMWIRTQALKDIEAFWESLMG